MTENFITYCILVSFLGMFVSGIFSFSKKLQKSMLSFFIASNVIGFIGSIGYVLNFSSQKIVFGDLAWLLEFQPSLTFLSGIFFALVTLVCAIVGVFSIRYLALYEKTYNRGVVQSLISFFVIGMLGVLLANNSFSFLFFWEVMSITSFFLVMADGQKESVNAAFLYFIMTHLGAGAILAGFMVLGGGFFNFDFSSLNLVVGQLSAAQAIIAFFLFLFGFGSKAGLLPFHVWLPEAHPQAPSNVSAMMSGLMLKIAVYSFIRIGFIFIGLPSWVSVVVIVLGLLSGVAGALSASIETDIKKAFAYSSIENMGIVFSMLGLSLYLFSLQQQDIFLLAFLIMVFAIFFAINHAIFKTALFLSSGVVISRVHSRSLEKMGGISKIMPLFSFAFLIAILSSLPVPPFGTFYGEWGFIQNIVRMLGLASLDGSSYAILIASLTALGLIGGLAVFAMVKIFGISMLALPRSAHLETRPEKSDALMIGSVFFLALISLVLGIFSKNILSWLMAHSLNLNQDAVAELGAVFPLNSLHVFAILAALFVLVYALEKMFAKKTTEREYQTWDCGQPIDATMEYTASAFSAPIRFFFLMFLGRKKMLKSAAVVETNPWIRKYDFSLIFESVWYERFYEPINKSLVFIANKLKKIQSGRIQYYLLFLLATLIITLITAL